MSHKQYRARTKRRVTACLRLEELEQRIVPVTGISSGAVIYDGGFVPDPNPGGTPPPNLDDGFFYISSADAVPDAFFVALNRHLQSVPETGEHIGDPMWIDLFVQTIEGATFSSL